MVFMSFRSLSGSESWPLSHIWGGLKRNVPQRESMARSRIDFHHLERGAGGGCGVGRDAGGRAMAEATPGDSERGSN